jgi:hypothetical protein
MSPLVVLETHDVRVAAPGRLGLLEEPLEMLAELRRLAAGEPAAARAAAPRRLAAYAGEAWASELAALGVPDAVVTNSFETFRREIWLWIEGDRRWDQLAGHLGARVMRRAVH